MKKVSKKVIIICVAVVVVLIIAGFAAVLGLRVDSAQAEQIALNQAGGGEIVEREISSDGLLNEYSYTIQNGDRWCKVEITGFGRVEEFESGTGQAWMN